MTVSYGFYNSVSGDRVYNAIQMSQLFDGLINDGVFASQGGKFMVIENSGMVVSVQSGRSWFNHSWTYNDGNEPITVPTADALLNRIDIVYLEVNEEVEVRENKFDILEGTPASSPVPPTLTNTSTIHQYPLAYIYVGAGVEEISQSVITNKVGTSLCPFVTGIIEMVDTDDLLLEWSAEWDEWFDAIKDQLTTEAETNLQAQIWAIVGDINPPLTDLIEIMSHNHVGVGSQIPTDGIAYWAITNSKIADNVISESKISNGVVTPDKLATTVAGNGLGGGGGTALYVRVDSTTIEIISDILRLKDGGVTAAKIADRTLMIENIPMQGNEWGYTASNYILGFFIVPKKYVSGGIITIWGYQNFGAGSYYGYFSSMCRYGQPGESVFTHSDSYAGKTELMSQANYHYILSNGLDLPSATPGDLVYVYVERQPLDPQDNLNDEIRLSGAAFIYTADS